MINYEFIESETLDIRLRRKDMFAWVGKRPGERKFRVIKTSTVGPEKQQKWRGEKKENRWEWII